MKKGFCTVVVHGPAGCGKTHNAERLRRASGCASIIDDWDGKDITAGALHLTTMPPKACPAWRSLGTEVHWFTFSQAMAHAGPSTAADPSTATEAALALGRQESDPHGTAQHAPGAKLDAGKMRVWLCVSGFSRALAAVADVTTKGAAKYTPNGWTEVPDGEARYLDAFGRHMLALGRGEQIDRDTQCLHKAQMAWNILASLELELRAAEKWETKRAQ